MIRRRPEPLFPLSLFVLAVGCAAVAGPRVELAGHAVAVEVADSRDEWVRGLSGREDLPEGRGMLFVFPDRLPRTFWMKDMRFPLDILWIDGDLVAGIARDLPPEGDTPSRTYVSGAPVDKVLEVPAGTASRWGIREGDRITFFPSGHGSRAPRSPGPGHGQLPEVR